MQCNFSTPSYSKQLVLPIEFAPTKVRAHGLKDAHTFPLVSMGKSHHGQHSASFRVPAADAWGFPEIELRAGNSWPSLVLDVDGSNALYRIVGSGRKGRDFNSQLDGDSQGIRGNSCGLESRTSSA